MARDNKSGGKDKGEREREREREREEIQGYSVGKSRGIVYYYNFSEELLTNLI